MGKDDELKRMRGLADEMAAEARRIFAHLPEGKIDEDEPLYFTQAFERLLIALPRGDMYFLEGDMVGRLSLTDEEVTLTFYKDGEQVQLPGRDN